MAITYTWNIKNMMRQVDTKFVTSVMYELEGTDGTKTGRAPGNITFDVPVDLSKIKPYEELTQADVAQWLQDSIPPERLDVLKAVVNAQINGPSAPTQESGLPWSN